MVMGKTVLYKDTLYLYCSGTNENNSSWPSRNRIVGAGRSMAGFMYPQQMGAATLGLDGYTHVQAKDGFGPGVLTTIPIQVRNKERAALQVNVKGALPYRSWVEVEILDAGTGKPLEGYGRNDCADLASDSNAAAVSWQGAGESLRSITISEIKLRFYLFGKARLHSFSFR